MLRGVVWCTTHAVRCCTRVHKQRNLKKMVRVRKTSGKSGRGHTKWTVGDEDMVDYDWHCGDDLSCWEKAHKFYIPKGLFKDVKVKNSDTSKPVFQNVQKGGKLFKDKLRAEGRIEEENEEEDDVGAAEREEEEVSRKWGRKASKQSQKKRKRRRLNESEEMKGGEGDGGSTSDDTLRMMTRAAQRQEGAVGTTNKTSKGETAIV